MIKYKQRAIRQETHEKRWRERCWRHFSMTHQGRMSWADWFFMRTWSRKT